MTKLNAVDQGLLALLMAGPTFRVHPPIWIGRPRSPARPLGAQPLLRGRVVQVDDGRLVMATRVGWMLINPKRQAKKALRRAGLSARQIRKRRHARRSS